MRKIFLILSVFILMSASTLPSYSYVLVQDLVFNGASVDPSNVQATLDQIKANKIANKKISNPRKKLPTKIEFIQAMFADPTNIKFEVDTSDVVVASSFDIQAPISNSTFLNAVQKGLKVWEDIEDVDIMFAPLKFSSGKPDPNDGRNVITARVLVPEGVPDEAAVFSFIQFARGKTTATIDGEQVKVSPGDIIDADIYFDPTNDKCLALFTASDDFTQYGLGFYTLEDGGFNGSSIDLMNCDPVKTAEIADLTVQAVALTLGLENSAIATSLRAAVSRKRARYLPQPDDIIGLSNIYPKKDLIKQRGTVSGKVTLDKTGVVGAHVVLEDTMTGEAIAGALTDINGTFEIKMMPPGTYNVYAEPLDGPVKKAILELNVLAQSSQLNFTTGEAKDTVVISAGKKSVVNLEVKEIAAAAFNINSKGINYTEQEYIDSGNGFLLPIFIMPGETLFAQGFWGSNISPSFNSVSFSGTGISASNITETHVFLTDKVECQDCEDPTDPEAPPCRRDSRCPSTQELTKQGDQLPGFTMDITCAPDAELGPRSIIIKSDVLDPTHPSFGLRDQITAAILVIE